MFGKVQAAASTAHIDVYLLGAILAIELNTRGVVHRQLEGYISQALLSIGREKRVEEMSLGVCQVKVRKLGKDTPVRLRVQSLLRTETCIDACAEILREACAHDDRSADNAEAWTRSDWRKVGHAYNGTFDYGDVLRCTYACLRKRFGLIRRSNVTNTSSGT
jgi:hypothetical protein